MKPYSALLTAFLLFLFAFLPVQAAPQARVHEVEQTDRTATADPTTLTRAQRLSLQLIFTTNKIATAHATLLVASTAKKIYENLLAEHPNRKLERELSRELHARAGEILSLHGQAMRQSLAVLTPAQISYLRAQRNKPDTPIDLLEQIGKTYGIGEK